MSQVTLTVISFGGRPVPDGDSKTFDERGGTIGRSASCDWVLPDPEHYLSSRHAALIVEDGEVLLIDTSTNGVFINHSPDPVGGDRSVPLQDGDVITAGDYEIQVSMSAGPARVAAAAPLAAAALMRPGQGMTDPLDLLGGPLTKSAPSAPHDDPFADLAPKTAPRASVTPARPTAGSAFAAPPADLEAVDPLALLDGDGGGRMRDDPFASMPSERDDLPFVGGAFQPPRASPEVIPEDWEDDLDLLAPAKPGARAAAPPVDLADTLDSPATVAPAAVPKPRRPSPAPAAAPATRAAPAARAAQRPPAQPAASATGEDRAEAGEALAAFLRGAGCDPAVAAGASSLQTLELAGELFALAMGGLREVLLARASLKSGFRMDVTYVAAVDNNPLKFVAGGVDEIVEKLLFRRSKGYLPPKESLDEAFDDLKAHQLGMVAGLRAGFDETFKQFDPAELEKRFEAAAKRGLLTNRKAQNWEEYCEWYAELGKAIDEAYEKLFGEAFSEAYQERTRHGAGTHKK
ncbi:MAG: type VI secretion system-associated FHA domain protein TagH [Gammaproteobacteria bacterium]